MPWYSLIYLPFSTWAILRLLNIPLVGISFTLGAKKYYSIVKLSVFPQRRGRVITRTSSLLSMISRINKVLSTNKLFGCMYLTKSSLPATIWNIVTSYEDKYKAPKNGESALCRKNTCSLQSTLIVTVSVKYLRIMGSSKFLVNWLISKW